MIQHILKIIWNERKANLWIVLELILIFSVLWFCADYLTFMFQRYMQPIGFNIENTYLIGLTNDKDKLAELVKETGKKEAELNQEYGWIIYNRIKQNENVEYAALSAFVYPYYGGLNSTSIAVNDDTIPVKGIYERVISPEYLDVFKVKVESGHALTWDDRGANKRMITGNEQDEVNKYKTSDVHTIKYPNSYSPEKEYEVTGSLNRMKRDPFQIYRNEVYQIVEDRHMAYLPQGGAAITIRVKENVNNKNFAEDFYNQMYDQITVGPYILTQVQSFEQVKEQYMGWNDYDNNFKSIYAIGAFLLINIFLGIIGTFWFRMRERRSEIGLRMALGSTRGLLQAMFIGETLLLLLIASIVATFLCINIGLTDVIANIGVPMTERSSELNMLQYFINFGVTFGVLALIAILAVWYPAHSASKIKPAIALHEE